MPKTGAGGGRKFGVGSSKGAKMPGQRPQRALNSNRNGGKPMGGLRPFARGRSTSGR